MYSKRVEEKLRGFGASIGDRIRIGEREGTLMPRSEAGDPECIVLKLDNGYNIGIEYTGQAIEKLGSSEKPERFQIEDPKFDEKKPIVAIIATGGTIASRIDYRTGGVVPALSAKELAYAVPEIGEFANIRVNPLMRLLSEDMRPENYKSIAGAVAKEIEDGADGIVILHGTDTMHYTASALSFMLRNLNLPVVLVGAQRSSDRGSSDAAMNLICAVNFAANADFAGVVICMHGTLDDKECHIHLGTRARKMHTSRRDAFKSIDGKPLASVKYEDGSIKFNGECSKRGPPILEVKSALEPKVGLMKVYPNMNHEHIAFFREKGYKGLVLEGTGLGHAPINPSEDSKENSLIREEIGKLAETCLVVMTTQCIYGDVNMHVYSTGRDLLKMGVISGKGMLAETAYVKLMWLLGNFEKDRAKSMVNENIAGEIMDRREITADFE